MNHDPEIMNRLRPGCICMGIKLYRILQAIDAGAGTYEEIARRTGIGAGDCGGRRCRMKVAEILRQKKKQA
mgnify:CR=1 FL=1